MSQQDLISLNLTAADFTLLDGAFDTIIHLFQTRGTSLTPDERIRLVKMGKESRPFCEQMTAALTQNASSLPAEYQLAGLQQDNADYDKLLHLDAKRTQMNELFNDTLMATGSDIMTSCILGGGILRAFNKLSNSLDTLLQNLTNIRRAKAAKKSKPATL